MTAEELREQDRFLEEVMKTELMKKLFVFLQGKSESGSGQGWGMGQSQRESQRESQRKGNDPGQARGWAVQSSQGTGNPAGRIPGGQERGRDGESPGSASPDSPTCLFRSLQLPGGVRAAFEGDVVRPLLPRGRRAGFQRLRARVLRYRPPPGPGRGQRRAGGSSRDPLLCLGEVKKGKVSGFHNWIRFYLLEKQGVVNYFSHNFDGPVRAPGGSGHPIRHPTAAGMSPLPHPFCQGQNRKCRGQERLPSHEGEI